MGKTVATTKVIEYDVKKGAHRTHANIEVSSVPGFNGYLFKQTLGLVRIVQLVLTIISLILVGSWTEIFYPHQRDIRDFDLPGYMYGRESNLAGEVYFFCAHTAVLTTLVIFLISYLFSTTSMMVVYKITKLEMVLSTVLGWLLIIAGIVELVMTVRWGYDLDRTTPLMYSDEWNMRLWGGILALLNGITFLISYSLAAQELSGKRKVPEGETDIRTEERLLSGTEQATHDRYAVPRRT